MLAQAGAEDVKRHKWFKGVDWEDVYYRFVTFFNFNFIFIIVITVHQGVDLGFLLIMGFVTNIAKELFVTE